MAKAAKLEVRERNPVLALQGFFRQILQEGEMDALLVARHLPVKHAVMPALLTDPEQLDGVDPLAPAFPINAAKVVSRLTRRPSGDRIVAVLRPCEIRAFIELVKLKQGSLEDVVLIGADCPGAYRNLDYKRFSEGGGIESTLRFLQSALSGGNAAGEGFDLSPACKSCELPVAENADITIGLFGVNTDEQLLLKANTVKGEELLARLKLPDWEEPGERADAVAALVVERTACRDRMFRDTTEATNDLEKLMGYLSNCVNCYNCRVACPVCYCKECVFLTDVFDHEPSQYLRWARKKGVIKMPTDTVFFHLTRLAHMSTACVGCGQCSNACPNDIPVMELFRTIAHHTQKAFHYEAGRSVEDEPPLSAFREKEFSEVTGGKD